MKKVSVIVTNYNGKKYLGGCFNSLLAQDYANIELIVSDDGSTDGSVEYVKANFPGVKISANSKNSGLAITSNNGARIAMGEYLFFYNNDTVASGDLISKLVEAMESRPDAGVACPLQLPFESKNDAEVLGGMRNGFAGCGADIYGNPCPAYQPEKLFYPDAAIFIKKEVFEAVGGFDADFFLYGEDVDICWRVHLLGYALVYAPKARFRHDSGCSVIQDGKVVTNIKRRALVERQVINMMLKYYRAGTLCWLLPKFMALFLAESLFFLIVKLKFKMFFCVYMQALWWNIRKFPSTMQKRRTIQTIRKLSDRQIMEKMYYGYAKLDGVKRMGVPVIR